MHPFPPISELQFLIGKEIGQVCLDPWGIQLRFEGGGRILLQNHVEHVDAAGRVHLYQDGDQRDLGPVFLRDVLLERIVKVDAEPFSLTLGFSNGVRLRVQSDDGPYECGLIETAEGRLVVF